MEYKSKFKGAEIDARLEKMLNVTWAELVALRNEGNLIAGQMYRMTDYDTACTWENTQVAGHSFDLVLTALDNNTLDERCSAIWSERDTEGYFVNSNLPAWDIRYCIDNDFIRFPWAQMGGKCLIGQDEWGEVTAFCVGVIKIGGISYIKWASPDGIILRTTTKNPQPGEEILCVQVGYEDDPFTVVFNSVKVEDRIGGKGVVYNLIDESENSVPYDFKNIMFERPLTEGMFDPDAGINTFCYTFSRIDIDTSAIIDFSLIRNSACHGNKFGNGCTNNVFLTTDRNGGCDLNVFGEDCSNNTFSESFSSNTFGSYCCDNTFVNGCYDNSFGDSFSRNSIGGDFSHNIFGAICKNNTFGFSFVYNTFGDDCYNNNFGDNCSSNIIGDRCSSNTLGSKFANNKIYATSSLKLIDAGSSTGTVRYYTFNNVNGEEVNVYRSRKGQTFITTKMDGTLVEYTIDDLIN